MMGLGLEIVTGVCLGIEFPWIEAELEDDNIMVYAVLHLLIFRVCVFSIKQ